MRPSLAPLMVVTATLCALPLAAQSAPADSIALVDSLTVLIRTRSVHRHTVDWTVVDTAFRRRLNGRPTFAGQLTEFRWLFQQLDDVHSYIDFGGRQVRYTRPMSTERADELRPLVELAQRQSGQPRAEALDAETGYLIVPGYSWSPDRAHTDSTAQAFHELICGLRPHPVNWIIDLRLNMGGTMHPMMAALAPLLGNGEAGGLVDADGRPSVRWQTTDGVFLHDGVPGPATVTASCQLPAARRIAVILGPITMSSGEMVAVAFRGRPDTRFFGEATAGGYSTANYQHRLREDLQMLLAEAVARDRHGVRYPTDVEPDTEIIGPHRFESIHDDPRVVAARRWFSEP